jgi:hypothetical protein
MNECSSNQLQVTDELDIKIMQNKEDSQSTKINEFYGYNKNFLFRIHI